MGHGGWGVGLHFRSSLRKPGRQTGGMSAAESSLSAQHSLHVVLIQSTVHPQQSRYREVAFRANPHFGFPETDCEAGC